MYSFLVLGIIPGTNIQLSLQAWLVIIAVLPFVAPRLKAPVRELIELGKAPTPHLPQHASQLHHRLQRTAR
ncbi:MAG TPA: hypothetical protein VMU97_02095 [Candidatus Dormibacteraeota bacterium]|nr:hypothetical protein [Candidatus Dormibacteraeota bacterium]